MNSTEYNSYKDLKSIQYTFDAIAAEFDITRYKPWPQTVEFVDDLADGSTILDLGCGNGRNIKYVAGMGKDFKIIGIDFSRPMLRLANNKIEQLEKNNDIILLQGDVIQLPLATSSVDAAIYVAALHHLPGADQRKASLLELQRVLRPGGKAFISVWDFEQERFAEELERQLAESSEVSEFGDVLVPWSGKRGQTQQRFYHLFYKDELEKLLGAINFKILQHFRAADNYHAVVAKDDELKDIQKQKNNAKKQKSPFEKIEEECRSKLSLSTAELQLLPAKWELLGDVLILKLADELKKHWMAIAKIYGDALSSKAVLRRIDKITGTYREPGVELLVGKEGNTETLHLENKIKFKLDPMRVMFSSGNIDERIRISTMAKPDETVVDMFAGIGYFGIPIAIHSKPKKVIACELNPVAYDYLCQNIIMNKVGGIVEPVQGDNRMSIPDGIADRIVMGYLKSEHSHREAALKILRPTGGIIHFHDVGFKDEVIDSAFAKFNESLAKSQLSDRFITELSSYYNIKSFGPKLVHAVLDIEVKPK